MFDRFTERASKWLIHRRTVSALRSLGPRELDDIGLSQTPTGEFLIPVHGYFGNSSYAQFATFDVRPSPEIAARQVIEPAIAVDPTPVSAAVTTPKRPRRRSPQTRKVLGASA